MICILYLGKHRAEPEIEVVSLSFFFEVCSAVQRYLNVTFSPRSSQSS